MEAKLRSRPVGGLEAARQVRVRGVRPAPGADRADPAQRVAGLQGRDQFLLEAPAAAPTAGTSASQRGEERSSPRRGRGGQGAVPPPREQPRGPRLARPDPARPTTRAVRHELFTSLHLPGQPPRYATEFDHLLKTALATYPRTLVLDEAQWLSSDQLEYVRYLWDDPHTQLAVVFVGGEGCYQSLRKEPMLSSRIFIWQRLARLTPEEVLDVILLYHPIWADADPDDIAFADHHATHGNFRNWARLTAHTRTALQRTGRTRVDREVLRWAFSRLAPTGS
ncbi:AAA family ATPase [Kitasatospora cineracea]|uniref:AAA family ATPase n=1 Tax=Kitasatospora cineracea TaxID=88074 RepID=UPI0036DADE81